MSREQIISQFLQNNGFGDFERVKIPGDASFRRYERLNGGQQENLILMDAPPETEDVKPFLKVGNILHKLKLSAPKIFAIDVVNGLLVIEDFGNDRYADLFSEKPSFQGKLYRQAIDVLAAIRNRGEDYDLPNYTVEVFLREANLFIEWYLPLVSHIESEKIYDLKKQFNDIMLDTLLKLNTEKRILVLRDFHSENLMYLPGREGEQSVGVIDFQDALMGHPAYDLVSLLDDARRDVSPELANELINYYLDLFPKIDREKFIEDYNILGAQRNLKILGIFARLKMRDDKDNYLKFMPRVKRYLLGNLQHPALKELKDFLLHECEL